MKQYPLSVPIGSYRGRDPKKRQAQADLYKVAEAVVAYINREMEKSERKILVFNKGELACETRQDLEAVSKVLLEIDASYNGVTVFKGDNPHDD